MKIVIFIVMYLVIGAIGRVIIRKSLIGNIFDELHETNEKLVVTEEFENGSTMRYTISADDTEDEKFSSVVSGCCETMAYHDIDKNKWAAYIGAFMTLVMWPISFPIFIWIFKKFRKQMTEHYIFGKEID